MKSRRRLVTAAMKPYKFRRKVKKVAASVIARRKAYYKANATKLKAYAAKYYAKNRVEILKRAKRRRQFQKYYKAKNATTRMNSIGKRKRTTLRTHLKRKATGVRKLSRTPTRKRVSDTLRGR
jgi:hypothetical protein